MNKILRSAVGVALLAGLMLSLPRSLHGVEAPPEVARLKDNSSEERLAAARALTELATKNSQQIKAMQSKELKPTTPEGNRAKAMIRLGHLAAAARFAVPALEALKAREKDDDVRQAAEKALVAMNKLGADGLATLREALKGKDAACKAQAAIGLGHLGSLAAPAIGDLTNALNDADPRVQRAASMALSLVKAKVSSPQALATARALVKRLDHQKNAVRAAAPKPMVDLAKDNPDVARIVVPALARTLRTDPDTYVRRMCAEALGEIGPLARDAIPALKSAAATNRDRDVVKAAEEALKKIGG